MDDEERIASCQREIFRLRNVIRYMSERENLYAERLKHEIEKDTAQHDGLLLAQVFWNDIMENEQ